MKALEKINKEMSLIFTDGEKKCVILGVISISIAMIYLPLQLVYAFFEEPLKSIVEVILCFIPIFSIGILMYLVICFFKDK